MSADACYLDTSAAVKLLVAEPESTALRHELQRWPVRIASALLGVERLRVAGRVARPSLMRLARQQLGAVHLVRLDQPILDRAAQLRPWSLRGLDALHLATPLYWEEQIGCLLTYDPRLGAAARELGVPESSPT